MKRTSRQWLPAAVLLTLAMLAIAQSPVSARADEPAILANIAAFFQTDDVARRQELATRIQADPAYDRGQVRRWLHQADLFKPLEPGRHALQVALSNNTTRTVVLRIPRGYDHRQPWPLIYALHGTGGTADHIIRYVEQILGGEVEQYVIAAPDRYEEAAVHDPKWPPVGEHPAALLKIKQTVHVDSDRVYVLGYSRGGHASWTLAVLHADQFAGAVPLAGTFILPLGGKMWETFLPNLASTPVLCVWGAGDIHGNEGQVSPDGGICGMNRKLRDAATAFNLPLTAIEDPDKAHGDIVPPADQLHKLLECRRPHYPRTVKHTFRDTYQGQAYWLEADEWYGSQWTDKPPAARMRPGESVYNDDDYKNAAARAYRQLLAELRGEIDGQQIQVHRKKIKELTVWVGDDMIDWDKPIVVTVSGRQVFEGKLTPDLLVCLTQAAHTRDFDRLRWAGLRVASSGRARLVTPESGAD